MLSLPERLIAGSRTSNLALWQTNHVLALLRAAWSGLACEIRPFTTRGDKTLDKPLPEVGGKGLFTLELEEALRAGEIDIAVHSLKDLPVEDALDLVVGAIVARADVSDVLVSRSGASLADLPLRARVGTSSRRRAAQLRAVRPDLDIQPIRGNVETRIAKVMRGDYDATVLAAAGLERLDLLDEAAEHLSLDLMLPAPGQGALAVQCRTEDQRVLQLLAAIDDPAVREATTAERAFLAALGGGCAAPVAAYACVQDGLLHLKGLVASLDGCHSIRVEGSSQDAEILGRTLADQALEQGAGAIIESVEPIVPPDVMSGRRPLQGRRIVNTRARHQAATFSQKLAELGATPVEVPLIRIAPIEDTRALDQAIRHLERYDWLILTSVNGAEIFWQRLDNLKRLELRAIGVEAEAVTEGDARTSFPKIATVGQKTADKVRQLGREPDFTPEQFVGEAIAEGLGDLNGLHILLPRAAQGRPELADQLAARGADVDDIPTYDTLPSVPDEAAISELRRGADAIAFTSSSAVRSFVSSFGTQWDEPLRQAAIACIGPVTAAAARDYGLPVAIVPDSYTIEGLLQALVDYFQGDGHA